MLALRPWFAAAVLTSAAPAFAKEMYPSPPPSQQPGSQQNENRPRVDVAFVLDTTGSMGGLIEGAKEKIWSMASKIARGKPAPILRVAVVAYRDVGDAYVAQRFDLTRDLDAVYAHLQTLNAEGGGDTPEHVGRGLGEAVKNLKWSEEPNTLKMIFVVGDAPAKHYHDGWDPEIWAQRAAKQGIVVNTLRCGGDPSTESIFQKLANLGKGSYSSLDSSGGVVAVRTPYDAKLAELNSAIASKTVYSGDSNARAAAEKKKDETARMDKSAAADRLSYAGAVAVGGLDRSFAPAAPAGASDLTAEPEAVASTPSTKLPEPLRAMSPQERSAFIGKLAKERRQLEEQATQVAEDREAWLKKNAAEKEDSFDGKVMEQVRGLGASHGIIY